MNIYFHIIELIRNGAVTEIPSGQYDTSVEDRGGFRIKCTDTANANWRVISVGDIEFSREVSPLCKYISQMSRMPDDRQYSHSSTDIAVSLCTHPYLTRIYLL